MLWNAEDRDEFYKKKQNKNKINAEILELKENALILLENKFDSHKRF